MTDRMVPPELLQLAEAHRRDHQTREADAWRRARMLYRGLAPESSTGSHTDTTRAVAWNYVWQICDAAVSSLVGSDIQIQAVPCDPVAVSEGQSMLASRLVSETFRAQGMAAELRQAILDAILLGRYAIEVRSAKTGPIIETLRPDTVYFDLSCRQPGKMRYILHAVSVHIDEVRRLIRERVYRRPDDPETALRPTSIPQWMGRLETNQAIPPSYVTIWRYYDIANNKVLHWLDNGIVLLEDEIPPHGCPIVIGAMASDGEDARGMSEVQLIARLQEILNALVSKAWEIAAVSEPVTIYDSQKVDSESVARIYDAAGNPGRFVGVDSIGSDPNPLAAHIHDLEQPQIPATHMQLLDLIPRIISQVSALSDLQRGQTVGAKTATEIALVQSEIKNRMAAREAMLSESVSLVAEQVWSILRRGGKETVVPVGDGYEVTSPKYISGEYRFSWTPYSATRQNPLLEAEQVQAFLPIAQAYPQVVSPETLVRHLYRLRGLPEDYLQAPAAPVAPLAIPAASAPDTSGSPSGADAAPPQIADLLAGAATDANQ